MIEYTILTLKASLQDYLVLDILSTMALRKVSKLGTTQGQQARHYARSASSALRKVSKLGTTQGQQARQLRY
jgi:hypothetical protein